MDDQPIFGVDPKTTGLTPMHFVRYFYYGGIVYIGTKRWKDALDSFLMVGVVKRSYSALLIGIRVRHSLYLLVFPACWYPMQTPPTTWTSYMVRRVARLRVPLPRHMSAG